MPTADDTSNAHQFSTAHLATQSAVGLHLICNRVFFLCYFCVPAVDQTLGILNVRLLLSDLCQQRLQQRSTCNSRLLQQTPTNTGISTIQYTVLSQL